MLKNPPENNNRHGACRLLVVERVHQQLSNRNKWASAALCINNMIQMPKTLTEWSLQYSTISDKSNLQEKMDVLRLGTQPTIGDIFEGLYMLEYINAPQESERGDQSMYTVFTGAENERSTFNEMKPKFFVVRTQLLSERCNGEEDYYVACVRMGNKYYALVSEPNFPIADIGDGLDALFTQKGRNNLLLNYINGHNRQSCMFVWPSDGNCIFVPNTITAGGCSKSPWNYMTLLEMSNFFHPCPVSNTKEVESIIGCSIQVLDVNDAVHDDNILSGEVIIVSGEDVLEDTDDAKWLAERKVRSRHYY